MVRCSNILITLLNIVTMLIAVAVVATGAYLRENSGTHCQRFLTMPVLVAGAFLFVVSFCGLVGASCKVGFLMWFYLVVMFLLILALMGLTIFTFVVTNKGAGEAVSNRGFKEYKLGDYSNWLQNHLVNEKNWVNIRACLADSKLCRSLGAEKIDNATASNITVAQKINVNAASFYKKHLSPTQSGCCKPPTACGFEFKNTTFWVAPKEGPAVEDSDCKTWSNDHNQLCYDCQSCKAGMLANIKSQGRVLSIINSCVVVVLVFIYSVGCCAFRNNRRDRYKYQRPYP